MLVAKPMPSSPVATQLEYSAAHPMAVTASAALPVQRTGSPHPNLIHVAAGGAPIVVKSDDGNEGAIVDRTRGFFHPLDAAAMKAAQARVVDRRQEDHGGGMYLGPPSRAPSRGLLPSGQGLAEAPRGPIPGSRFVRRGGKSQGHPIIGMRPSGKGGHGGGHPGHGHHGHGHGGHHGGHWRGRGVNSGRWGGWDGWSVWPSDYLAVMGWDPRGWCGMSDAVKAANVAAWLAANPGSIANPAQFIEQMNAYCLSYGAMSVGPSGDLTWSAGGAAVGTATDDLGYTVSVDASGNPIPGTVSDNGSHVDDSYLDVYGELGPVTRTAGGGSSGSQAAADAAVRAAWSAVDALIGQAGTDIYALIVQGGQTARAQINADLQTALHGTNPQTGAAQPLSPAQVAQIQQVLNYLNPPPPVSTATKVAYGGAALGVGYIALKLLGVV